MSQFLVEGWTERIRTQLLADGTPFPLTDYDLPPAAVEMILATNLGAIVTPSGVSGIDTPSTGIVYFDPEPSDLLAKHSPYSVRWKVTDSDGKSVFFPNDAAEQWIVHEPNRQR